MPRTRTTRRPEKHPSSLQPMICDILVCISMRQPPTLVPLEPLRPRPAMLLLPSHHKKNGRCENSSVHPSSIKHKRTPTTPIMTIPWLILTTVVEYPVFGPQRVACSLWIPMLPGQKVTVTVTVHRRRPTTIAMMEKKKVPNRATKTQKLMLLHNRVERHAYRQSS